MSEQPPTASQGLQTPPASLLAPTISTVVAHGALLALIALCVMIVLPRFREIFASFGTELPARTVFVINIGTWVKEYALLVPVLLVGFMVLDGLVYYHLRQHGATGWARAWWLFWLLLEGAAVLGIVIAVFLPLVHLMRQVGSG